MTVPTKSVIQAGFIPLIDAAPLIVAATKGFADAEGITIELSRATSWATIRDRLAVGQLDVAHALAPLPIAANLGLNPLQQSLTVPIAFGFGGNTIVLAMRHLARLRMSRDLDALDPTAALDAIKGLVEKRRQANEPLLKLGVVHPHSAHRYNLEYWLAARGLLSGRDVDIVVLPPSLMPAALSAGRLDGFCAGEPWGSVAVANGDGAMLTTTTHIWPSGPEKVLAVRSELANDAPEVLQALVRALYVACAWCDELEHRDELAQLLSRPEFVGADADQMTRSLARNLNGPTGERAYVASFLTFAKGAASFPWISHALWFSAQMARWSEIELNATTLATVRATYRPDIYRDAVRSLGANLPSANAKVEGALNAPQAAGSTLGRLTLAADGFFDGRVFDPDHIETYLADLRVADRRLPGRSS